MNSKPAKSSKCDDDRQGLILCCQVCGHTWTALSQVEVIKMPSSNRGVTCYPCIYLDMARRHANAQKLSMREAVRRYLVGTTKRSKLALEQVWKQIPPESSG